MCARWTFSDHQWLVWYISKNLGSNRVGRFRATMVLDNIFVKILLQKSVGSLSCMGQLWERDTAKKLSLSALSNLSFVNNNWADSKLVRQAGYTKLSFVNNNCADSKLFSGPARLHHAQLWKQQLSRQRVGPPGRLYSAQLCKQQMSRLQVGAPGATPGSAL